MAPLLRARDRPHLGVVRGPAQSRGHPAAALLAPRRALSPVRRQPDRRALVGRVAERVTGLTAGGLDGPPDSDPRSDGQRCTTCAADKSRTVITAANTNTSPAVNRRERARPGTRAVIAVGPGQVPDEQPRSSQDRPCPARSGARRPCSRSTMVTTHALAPARQHGPLGGRHLGNVGPAPAPDLLAVGLVDLDPVAKERAA